MHMNLGLSWCTHIRRRPRPARRLEDRCHRRGLRERAQRPSGSPTGSGSPTLPWAERRRPGPFRGARSLAESRPRTAASSRRQTCSASPAGPEKIPKLTPACDRDRPGGLPGHRGPRLRSPAMPSSTRGALPGPRWRSPGSSGRSAPRLRVGPRGRRSSAARSSCARRYSAHDP